MCLTALIICLGAGIIITLILKKKTKIFKTRLSTLMGSFLFGILIMAAVAFGYLSIYYPAGEKAIEALNGNDQVQVTHISKGYFFDGQASDTALIFYPGAKVDAAAYAPLMLNLAESGIDCFLTEMPFHMAIIGSSSATDFIERYDYENWIMAGHSMGGLVAANFTAEHTDVIDGLVLLGAYSTTKLEESVKVLSIYGDRDQVLGKQVYEDNKGNLPHLTEVVISGGNHAQYADYGFQKGDGEATISDEDQTAETVKAIMSSFGS